MDLQCTTHCDGHCPASTAPFSSSAAIPRRPYAPAGALARTLYNKQFKDEELHRMDKRQWYLVQLKDMPAEVREAFVLLDCDEDTQAFLDEAHDKSEWILTQLWHSFCKLFLGWFFTQTSLNGFLGRGSMFVFSTAQVQLLLGHTTALPGGRLVDLGAGDGAVTARMAPLFKETATTEVSPTMRRALSRRGFRVLELEEWVNAGPWDVVSCLNVLDRCSRPWQLLGDIRRSLAPNGKAVIALVLPYKPYVEVGGKPNHQPEELLPIRGETFDQQVSSVVADVLRPAGFVLERWARLPYLCEGDLHQAFYWLHDAVFIVHAADDHISGSKETASE